MATFYFNGAVDGEWTELGNWWMDDTFTTQATALPTGVDDVIATASITSNSGSEPTVANFTLGGSALLGISITVTGVATFNNISTNGGAVSGDATFNDGSANVGTINGNCTFNDSSVNGEGGTGTVSGDATFNGSSVNYGTVSGDAVFNDGSSNGVTVNGDATFNDSSFAYPTGTYNGTVTFQNRTPYPLNRGVNSSSLLAVV